MTMTIDQRERLTEIEEALSKIDGVHSAQSDDFDSHYINVFIYLESEGTHRPVYKWLRPIRSVKAAILRVLKEQGINECRFLDQPQKQREYNGRVYGKTLWFDKGYDIGYIKIEIPLP